MTKGSFLKISCLFVVGFLLNPNAFALGVNPGYQLITVEAGKKVTGEFEITNTFKEKVTVTVFAKDWMVLPDNKNIHAEEWLRPKSKRFELKPDQKKKVQFEIRAPKEAKGELMALMSFSPATYPPQGFTLMSSNAVYAAIKGTEKLEGELSDVKVNYSSSVISVQLLMANNGNVHIRLKGSFDISDSSSSVIQTSFEPQSPLYPGKSEIFNSKPVVAELKPGNYRLKGTLVDHDRPKKIWDIFKEFTITPNYEVKMK